jgi:hypothetical protein
MEQQRLQLSQSGMGRLQYGVRQVARRDVELLAWHRNGRESDRDRLLCADEPASGADLE